MSDQPKEYPHDQVVDSIIVQQDVGGPYPEYKRVKLNLLADGRVEWDRDFGVYQLKIKGLSYG